MPSQASLAAGQYYAHPQNCFWRIIADLLDLPADLPYRERTRRFTSSGLALWDVCKLAHRPGSLDTAIEFDSIVANDLAGFLREHRHVKRIYFNGTKAAQLYRRTIPQTLPEPLRAIPSETLPSTSPANASLPYRGKLSRWSIVREAWES